MQAVLNWTNLIDHEGISSDVTHLEPREILPGLAKQDATTTIETPQQTETAQQKALNIGSGTQVPADLVDELLQQAGEAMILNIHSQLYDRPERTVQQRRSVQAQNTILQQVVGIRTRIVRCFRTPPPNGLILEIASANGIRLTALTYSLYTTVRCSALTGQSPAGQGDRGSWT